MSPIVIISAMVPPIGLIALGLFLRRLFKFDEPFWRETERLTYYLLLPALFITSLAKVDFNAVPIGRMAAVLALASFGSAIVGLASKPLFAIDGPGFTSVFQGMVRFNNYVGAVIASALFGAEGLALAALCNAVLVPIVNVFSTLVLAKWGTGQFRGWGIVKAVATNPLIGACVIGIGLNLIGQTPPGTALLSWPLTATIIKLVGTVLSTVGQAALPIGLLCVGAGLQRAGASSSGTTRTLALSAGIRLTIVPAIAFGLAHLIGLSGPAAVVAVLFQALPTASSAYVLARRLGGDAPLAAAIIAAQTVVAMATLPVWLYLSMSTLA